MDMRNRFLMSGATMALTVLLAGVLAAAVTDDDYDERLDDLEARVARLEAKVGIGTPTTSSEEDDEDSGVSASTDSSSASTSSSSSTSASSVQSGSGSFSGSYASTGDRVIELELSNGGVYRLTAQPTAALSLRVETAAGEEVPAFSLDIGGGETRTVEGTLEPGSYVIRVDSDSAWVVNITLAGA
jgi:hypothetical protein